MSGATALSCLEFIEDKSLNRPAIAKEFAPNDVFSGELCITTLHRNGIHETTESAEV
jgi:hypothetical protein